MISDDSILIQSEAVALSEPKKEIIKKAGGVWDQYNKGYRCHMKQYENLRQQLEKAGGQQVHGIPEFAIKAIQPITEKLSFSTGKKKVALEYQLQERKTVKNSIPAEIVKGLYDFQRVGIQFGLNNQGRVLIADEMGVGKTIQAVCLASCYKSAWPLVILSPSSLKYNWKDEILKWDPSLKESQVQIIGKSADDVFFNTQVLICSYDIIPKIQDKLTKLAPNIAIADEAHYLKNPVAKRTISILPFLQQLKHVILLTGTPAFARPKEMFTLLSVVRPDIFKTFKQFGDRYCDPKPAQFGMGKDYQGSSNERELHYILKRQIMIRRLKDEVLSELPKKRRKKVMVNVDKSTLGEIKSILKKANKSSLESLFESLHNQKALPAFGEEQNNKNTYHSDQANFSAFALCYRLSGLAKLKELESYIEDLLENDLKLIIFAHHQEMMNALENFVNNKLNQKSIRIDGQVMPSERHTRVTAFQTDTSIRVAILSLAAASSGLTLTASSNIIFAEMHWTPAIMQQAEDRAHRIGQENSVLCHYIIGEQTFDELLYKKIEQKIAVVSNILDGQKKVLHIDSTQATNGEIIEHDEIENIQELEEEQEQGAFGSPSKLTSIPQLKKQKKESYDDHDDDQNQHENRRYAIDDMNRDNETAAIATGEESDMVAEKNNKDSDSSEDEFLQQFIANQKIALIVNQVAPQLNQPPQKKQSKGQKNKQNGSQTCSKKKSKKGNVSADQSSNIDQEYETPAKPPKFIPDQDQYMSGCLPVAESQGISEGLLGYTCKDYQIPQSIIDTNKKGKLKNKATIYDGDTLRKSSAEIEDVIQGNQHNGISEEQSEENNPFEKFIFQPSFSKSKYLFNSDGRKKFPYDLSSSKKEEHLVQKPPQDQQDLYEDDYIYSNSQKSQALPFAELAMQRQNSLSSSKSSEIRKSSQENEKKKKNSVDLIKKSAKKSKSKTKQSIISRPFDSILKLVEAEDDEKEINFENIYHGRGSPSLTPQKGSESKTESPKTKELSVKKSKQEQINQEEKKQQMSSKNTPQKQEVESINNKIVEQKIVEKYLDQNCDTVQKGRETTGFYFLDQALFDEEEELDQQIEQTRTPQKLSEQQCPPKKEIIQKQDDGLMRALERIRDDDTDSDEEEENNIDEEDEGVEEQEVRYIVSPIKSKKGSIKKDDTVLDSTPMYDYFTNFFENHKSQYQLGSVSGPLKRSISSQKKETTNGNQASVGSIASANKRYQDSLKQLK